MSSEVKSERVRRKQRRRRVRRIIRNLIILLVIAGVVIGVPFLTNRSVGSYARSILSAGRGAVQTIRENVHPGEIMQNFKKFGAEKKKEEETTTAAATESAVETTAVVTTEAPTEPPTTEPPKPAVVYTTPYDDEIAAKIAGMTLEEKVAQLFIVVPEAVTGVDAVTAAGELTRQAIAQTPVGGFLYSAKNFESAEQVKQLLGGVQSIMQERIGVPALLCVTEEGGAVNTVAASEVLGIQAAPAASTIRDAESAAGAGETIGAYLSDLGFNLDLAPVADTFLNKDNTELADRTFGTDPMVVAELAQAMKEGLESRGVAAVYKHFPGMGTTTGNSREGTAASKISLDQLQEDELFAFGELVGAEASAIMVGAFRMDNLTGKNNPPVFMSTRVVSDLLRQYLGFEGVVFTDDLSIPAVTQKYTSDKAAVNAIKAGCDVLLTPENFQEAYQGVLQAVADGTLKESRIDKYVTRIFRLKYRLMNEKAPAAAAETPAEESQEGEEAAEEEADE